MTAGNPGKRSAALDQSSYLAGLQCERRLWLEANETQPRTPGALASLARTAADRELAEHARELFPGGVLVATGLGPHAEAVERTATLLADRSVPAIFGAAFEHAGVRVRVDVLERLAGQQWGLGEVRAASAVAAEHLDSLALQRFVLEGAGLQVSRCELIHIDTGSVRGEDEMDWRRALLRAGCDAALGDATLRVSVHVSRFHTVLRAAAAPEVEPGFHCSKPHTCAFWEDCTREKPDDWLFRLPELQEPTYQALRDTGCERIGDLPRNAAITPLQQRVRAALQGGGRIVAPELPAAFAGAGPPAWYLTFHAANPAVPLFAGTRPFQNVAFQWSLHYIDADGNVSHQQFLADGGDDPRREFCETLSAALWEDAAPVHVYSAFEAAQLSALATEFPALAPALGSIRERLFDQSALVRAHVYDAKFAGSFELAKVAPALVPGFGWGGDDDRGVADATAAATAWHALVAGDLDAAEAAHLRAALLAYAERYTLAMLELHQALCEL